MMGCKSAIRYDADTNRYECAVSGGECMFLLPNSKLCAEIYGEGPDADSPEENLDIRSLDNEDIYPPHPDLNRR